MSASIGLSAETCAKKRRYRTSKDAKAARRSMQAIAGGPALSVFRCPRCAGWHLGHRPAWGRAQVAGVADFVAPVPTPAATVPDDGAPE